MHHALLFASLCFALQWQWLHQLAALFHPKLVLQRLIRTAKNKLQNASHLSTLSPTTDPASVDRA
jgi:hypothetical protein